MRKPICTVLFVSYNHASYIRKAFESVLSQKTRYAFKIHVFDDASTDGSADIIREYAEKYPDKVFPFISEQNQGAQTNIWNAYKSVDTKYFTLLETDDYWCNENKLEMQIAALEKNPDCSFCSHQSKTINLNDEYRVNEHEMLTIVSKTVLNSNKVSLADIEQEPVGTGYFDLISARLVRSSAINLDKIKYKEAFLWDNCQLFYLLLQGKMYFINEVMSVYQMTGSGAYSGYDPFIRMTKYCNAFIQLNLETNNILGKRICQEIIEHLNYLLSLDDQYKNLHSPVQQTALPQTPVIDKPTRIQRVKYTVKGFAHFLGKLRRKFLKLLFGRQLIRNIETMSEIIPLINQVTNHVLSLSGQVAEQGASLSGHVTEKVSAVSSEVASLSGQVAEQGASLSGQVAEQGASLSGHVTEKVSAVSSEVASLSGQVAEQVASLSNHVTEKVSAVSSEVASLSGQVAEQVASLSNHVTEKVSAVSSEVASLSGQIKEKDFDFELVLKTIELQRTHQETFARYKNCFHGKNVVLVATGPTLADFKAIDNAVYVGVNAAFMFEKVSLDYLFMQDYTGVKKYIEDSLNYKNKNLKRFYGSLNPKIEDGVEWTIPESIIVEHNASKYYVENVWYRQNVLYGWNFALDPSSEIIRCYGGVAFHAMQFILYGNPQKVYLAGCDTTLDRTKHAIGPDVKIPDPEGSHYAITFGWKELKKFASVYYPDTEIISVNPVGLTGLFRDVYTKSYLEKHPEIQGEVL
ncbi:hypothetical protein FACS189494_04320 [Spirochaetia bacterium]|nr:hypothetical protein FACS189494_04320 [Spirochaetia bacterium]